MATQTFRVERHQETPPERYDPRPVVYNNQFGHIWARWVWENQCWVFKGQQFHHIKATRKQIAEGFRQIES